MDILTVRGLEKAFGDKQVLRGIDLSVPTGSVFGFIGKNGAGKTTTMKAILGLLRVDAGEILIDGQPVRYGQSATNRIIGYLPDVPEFYSFMNAREYLSLCGESLQMPSGSIKERSEELLKMIQDRIDAIYDQIVSTETYKALEKAQNDVNDLMEMVNSTITFNITGEMPSCTHDCSTCGGCH